MLFKPLSLSRLLTMAVLTIRNTQYLLTDYSLPNPTIVSVALFVKIVVTFEISIFRSKQQLYQTRDEYHQLNYLRLE